MTVTMVGRRVFEASPFYPSPGDATIWNELVTPASPIFTTAPVAVGTPAIYGSGAWLSANNPLAMPFILSRAQTVYQLGWYNGSSAGDNADVGIYDASWSRIVSAGSTLASGSGAPQFVDVADTALSAGTLYYLVGCRDTTTTNRLRRWNVASAPALGLLGMYASADASFPLPDPLTNMTLVSATWTTIPEFIIAFRALV